MTAPPSFTIPDRVLLAARWANDGWRDVHPRVLRMYASANWHMAGSDERGEQDSDVSGAAKHLFDWGRAVREGLGLGYILSTFSSAPRISWPLEIIQHEIMLSPLPPPIDAPGGRLRVRLSLNLNPSQGVFLIKTWFEDRELPTTIKEGGVPRNTVRVMFAEDLTAHVHPAMLKELDRLKDEDQFWDKLMCSLGRLVQDLQGM